MTTRLGRVSRVTGGRVYVELADVAPGFEFGPVLDTVGGLAVGDRVIATGLARDPDELVVIGILGGRDYATEDELEDGLADKAPLAHTHHADDVTSGVLALDRLPVATSGVSDATKLVRSDDERVARPYLQSIGTLGPDYTVINDSAYRRPTILPAIAFDSRGTSAIYRLAFSLDVETFDNGGYIVAAFAVDGVQLDTPVAVLRNPSGLLRTTLATEVRVTGLSAGSHSVEVRVSSLATGTPKVYSHGTLHVELIS